MFEIDIDGAKKYIQENGFKQKVIAEKSGIGECKLSLVLLGKRKLEAGEYASLCGALGIPMNKFVRPRLPNSKGE